VQLDLLTPASCAFCRPRSGRRGHTAEWLVSGGARWRLPRRGRARKAHACCGRVTPRWSYAGW